MLLAVKYANNLFKQTFQRVEAKTVPQFVCREEQASEPSSSFMQSLWDRCSLIVQAELMVHIAKDLSKTIKVDHNLNMHSWREKGEIRASFLESLNLSKYLKNRDLRLVSFLMGFVGLPLDGIGENLPQLVIILESLYKMVVGSVMPFSFSVNVFVYKKFHSDLLCNILGGLFGCGKSTLVSNWLHSYSENHEPQVNQNSDVVFGCDNEQQSGKNYSIGLASKLMLSCICVVIAFFLPFKTLLQYTKIGMTSSWRIIETSVSNG
jgi:hypothetical protein